MTRRDNANAILVTISQTEYSNPIISYSLQPHKSYCLLTTVLESERGGFKIKCTFAFYYIMIMNICISNMTSFCNRSNGALYCGSELQFVVLAMYFTTLF